MNRSPLVPAAFALGAAILAGWYAGGNLSGLRLFPLFFLSGIILMFIPAGKRYHWFFLLLLPIVGLVRAAGERREHDCFLEYTRAFAGKTVTVIGTVADLPAPWREGCRFPLHVEKVAGEEAPSSLRWEVFLAGGESTLRSSDFGERLIIRGRVFGEQLSTPVPSVTRWTREKISGGLMVDAGGYMRAHDRTDDTSAGDIPGVYACMRAVENAPTHQAGGRPGPAAVIKTARRRLLAVGEQTLSPQAAALLHGMLLGAREGLAEMTAEDFRRAGVAHLLSVSGLHLLFWLGLFWGLGKLLGLSERWLAGLSIPVVLVFLVLAGAGAPALRAGVMALAGIFGRRAKRPVRGDNILALAACVILLLRPLELFSRGFWLSFAACGGLLFLLPVWEEALIHYFRGKNQRWFRPCLASLAAQAGTVPLSANFFGGVTLLAPLTNLLLIPLGSACIQLGLTAAMTGLFFLPAARVLNAGNEVLLGCFNKLLGFFAEFGGYMRVSSLPWPAVGGFYTLTAVFTWGLIRNPINRRRRIPLFYLLLILFLLVLAGLGWTLVQQSDPSLNMVVFDVGQGDAVLFTIPGGYMLMVDGGTGEGYLRGVRPYFQEHGINRLDLLVLTHPHEDHVGGLVRMLEEDAIRVAHILESGYPHTTRSYSRFLEIITERDIPYTRAVRGSSFRLGEIRGMVLHPPASHLSGTRSDVNNNSVVLLLDYENIRILLTGDIEKEAEEELLATHGNLLRANILKVAHHGGASSTSWEWVAATRPDLAIICVGKNNRFGHPAPVVLENLQQAGTVIRRTDTDGRLNIRIKKGRVEMKRGAEN